jgi:transcriptional regulator with XRE-family HTH domain
MQDQRVGRVVRALRRRRGWRQLDLAQASGCSQTLISLLERGHIENISLPVMRRTLAALEAWLVIDVRWRGAALDRLLDEDHASLVAWLATVLGAAGWLTEIEVTYAHYREHGSYDVLGFHPPTGIVLVIEVKTDLPSAEATLRKLDEKTRLAPTIARERFGWHVRGVSRLLVMPENSTLRRRIHRHAALFGRALPVRGHELRRWLAAPAGRIAGLWFLSSSSQTAVIKGRGGRHRVRRPQPPSGSRQATA